MFICVNTCFHRHLQMCSQCRHMYKLVHMFRHPVLMFAHNVLTLCSHVLTLYSPWAHMYSPCALMYSRCTHPVLTCAHYVLTLYLCCAHVCSPCSHICSPCAYLVTCVHTLLIITPNPQVEPQPRTYPCCPASTESLPSSCMAAYKTYLTRMPSSAIRPMCLQSSCWMGSLPGTWASWPRWGLGS